MANWKEIAGYEGKYLVSDEGDVMSLPREKTNQFGTFMTKGKILKPGKRGNEGHLYYFVILSNNGKNESKSVHRLVAEAFLENPQNLPEVNHKDKNQLNNHVENLEWCDRQYNIEYSKNKKVAQYTLEGEKIAVYKSVKYAAQVTGILRTAINQALVGKTRTSGGYIWKYETEE